MITMGIRMGVPHMPGIIQTYGVSQPVDGSGRLTARLPARCGHFFAVRCVPYEAKHRRWRRRKGVDIDDGVDELVLQHCCEFGSKVPNDDFVAVAGSSRSITNGTFRTACCAILPTGGDARRRLRARRPRVRPQGTELGRHSRAGAPGLIRTASAEAESPPEIWEQVGLQQLIRHKGESRALIGALFLLCSDDAAFITGQTRHVHDGAAL